MGRFEEANAVIDTAFAHKLDHFYLHANRYQQAFLRGDTAGMQREAAWVSGKPEEGFMLTAEADTEAYYGHMRRARELWRRAVDAAKRNDNNEAASTAELDEASTEADFGNSSLARQGAVAALALAPGRDVRLNAAFVLAEVGDETPAQKLVDGLNGDHPTDTVLQCCWLPIVRATIELRRGHGLKAIELLERSEAYELGQGLSPAYVRGLAYLRNRQGKPAAAEFEKILNHPSVVGNSDLGPLTRLGLARALAMYGDAIGARTAYQDFLTLWKDADPDIPIFNQAKAEYAKLQ
jgi:hypothetical protein